MPGQPHSAAPSAPGSDSGGPGWLLGALFAVGVVAALIFQEITWVAVSLILDYPEGTDSEAVFLGFWLVVEVVPVALLWIGRGRRGRWFAGGATAGTIVAIVLTVVSGG